MSNYSCISNFGKGASKAPSNNPLTYCLAQTVDNMFMHGGISDGVTSADGRNCQAFMSEYCANNWDNSCEYASNNSYKYYPNMIHNCKMGSTSGKLTSGEILIQNTAMRKYLSKMHGTNDGNGCRGCTIRYEPFDPTVADSPMISFWNNEYCIPEYEVNPKEIDSDPVMNKILAKPIIAWSLLVNIYNTARRKETLKDLKGTKIYRLFQSSGFQKYIEKM